MRALRLAFLIVVASLAAARSVPASPIVAADSRLALEPGERSVSLFGEVIAQDPTRIRPNEEFRVEVVADVKGGFLSVFVGSLGVVGATIGEVDCNFCLFVSRIEVEADRLFVRAANNNKAGEVLILGLDLQASAEQQVRLELLGDEGEVLAQELLATMQLLDILRITERVPLELRADGVSLGTSLTIVPEPATLILLALGLAGVALRRRRAW